MGYLLIMPVQKEVQGPVGTGMFKQQYWPITLGRKWTLYCRPANRIASSHETRVLGTLSSIVELKLSPPNSAAMSFFDNKARAAAAKAQAANGASSSKSAAAKDESSNLQPWVEK